MRIHERELLLSKADAEFTLGWTGLNQSKIDTYAGLGVAFNAIERHWLVCDSLGKSAKDTAAEWGAFDLAGIPEEVAAFARDAGSLLANMVFAHELTHGEVMWILANQRLSCARHHIRSERHPSGAGD